MKKFTLALCLAATFTFAQTTVVDPCTQTTKLSGGTNVSSKYQTGKISGTDYEYEIWSDGSAGNLTYYGAGKGGDAAFKAVWNNNGDFLSRVGYKWDVSGKSYKNYGDIYADYNYTRSGKNTAGDYSYIGIYGWVRKTSSTSTIEYYIVDDWFGNQWNEDTTPVGEGTIGKGSYQSGKDYTMDGATYKVYKNRRTNAYSIEADRDNFDQYFSVRQTPRKCGTISITEHFKKWEAAGMPMSGTLFEAKILVEAGGGSGNIDFSYAKMRIGGGTTTQSSGSTGGTSSSSGAEKIQATTCKTPLIDYPTKTVPSDPYTACFKYTNNKCYVCKIENEGEFEGNMNTCASSWVWDGSQIDNNLKDGYWYYEVPCSGTTPIAGPSQLTTSTSQAYYSLKGEPLGNAKPQKAGVYIVKEGYSVKKIAVR